MLGGLAVAALAGPAFVVVEHRSSHPMLPLGLFRSRQFSGANGVTFAVYGALGGALFLLPVELQLVAHYTPLESGLALLPLTLVMLTFSARSGQLSARIGPRLQMTVGPLIVGAGLALLVRATHPGNYLTQVFPAVLVFAIGLVITVAPLTATAMGAAPTEHSGVASAVNNVVARAAGLFAVSVLPLVAGLTGAAALAPQELAAGFRTAMLVSAVTCALGGVLAALTIRNPVRARAATPGQVGTWSCGVSGPPVAVAAASPGTEARPARLSPRAHGALVGQGKRMARDSAGPEVAAAPEIFAPAALGPVTLRNRIIKAATFEGRTPRGEVGDELVEFHRRVAAGGVGMTTVAYLAVSPEGRTDRHCSMLSEETVPGLRRLTDAVHGEGAAAAAQIGHAGPVANARSNGAPALSPSGGFTPMGSRLRAIEVAGIERVIDDYRRAATLAVEAGFDSIEVHVGHNYLLSAFLSPKLNKRDDQFGGPIENRARFARTVLRTVRDAAGPAWP